MPATASQALPDEDCRCLCGNLLARLVAGGVELKCRRCKRTQVIPLQGTPSTHPEARGRAPRAQSAREARQAARVLPSSEPGPCLSASSSSDS
jgi:phage FluMu protein Com